MACKFEQVGKDWRIEIPPLVSVSQLLMTCAVAYCSWCIASLGAEFFRGLEESDSYSLRSSLIGALSGLALSTIAWFTEYPGGRLSRFGRDISAFVIISALIGLACSAIWPSAEEIPTGIYVMLGVGLMPMVGVFIVSTSYHSEVLIDESTVNVYYCFFGFCFQRYQVDRRQSDVDFDYQFTSLAINRLPIPKLNSVLLKAPGGALQLGLGLNEEELRRLHELLQPIDVVRDGDGIWEFSDPHLRHGSKVEVSG